MSARAILADTLLRASGDGGLWEWAMDQRRSVTPPNWDEVARRLSVATDGKISIRGDMLRKWLFAAEAERDAVASESEE